MRVLDEEGRLFGRVNVVDAAVVLVALGLVVGGGFVVATQQPGDSDPGVDRTRYATVGYTVGLDSPGTQLSAGDEVVAAGEAVQVSDVYRSTTSDGRARVTAHVEYGGNLTIGGSAVLAGDEFRLQVPGARVDATVLAVDQERDALRTQETALVVATNASAVGGTAVEPGDEVRVGGAVVASVTGVSERGDGGHDVAVTARTRQTAAGPAYGGRPLRIGDRVGLVTDEVAVYGRVASLGSTATADGEGAAP